MPTAQAGGERPVSLRVCAVVASGTVLLLLNSSIIAIAIVATAAQFGSLAGVSWIITALCTTTAVSAATAGRLGVALGACRVFLAGQAVVVLASLTGVSDPNVAEKLGDESNCTAILRHLWEFRAKGGVAHFAGSEDRATRAALGIEDMNNVEAFESVIARITTMLENITGLMEAALPEEA